MFASSHTIALTAAIPRDEAERRLGLFHDGLYEASRYAVFQFYNPRFTLRERRLFFQYPQLAPYIKGILTEKQDMCMIIGTFHAGISIEMLWFLPLAVALFAGLIWFDFTLCGLQHPLFLWCIGVTLIAFIFSIILIIKRNARSNDAIFQKMIADLGEILAK